MKKLLTICMFVFLAVMAAKAQTHFERYPCVHGIQNHASTRLPVPSQDWDASRTYRQAVILVQYSDMAFSMDDPKSYYHDLLNVSTSKTRGGAGCAADYFRDQSNGLFNLQFDVIGPVKVSQTAQINSTNTNYAERACKEAVKKAVDSLHVDFSVYDWNGNNDVEQIVFIVAGYCANGGNSSYSKYVWPNTGMLFGYITETLSYSQMSVTAEKFFNDIPCGIGTICHEYSHCLGLPDLFPTSDDTGYSVVDEWDLMDGGNYTSWGWCPPNYSALEKYLLGWLSFDEITSPVKVSGMKTVADGGKAYKMVKEGDTYYVLENRQRKGWDKYLPGEGLLITYVNYNKSKWKNNNVNYVRPFSYEFVHADGMDYDAWDAYIKANGLTAYVDTENRLWRRHLSTSSYPLLTDTLEVHECNELPMPLTDIQLSDDGRISFEVVASGIRAIGIDDTDGGVWYDLQGRRLTSKPGRKGIYIHNHKKEVIR